MNEIILIKYLSFSHLFIFSLAYVLLNKIWKKGKRNIVMFLFIVGMSIYIGTYFSELDLLLLFSLSLFLSLKNNKKESISIPLLTVSFAYIIEWLTSRVSQPLFLKVFFIESIKGQYILFFLLILLVFSITYMAVNFSLKIIFPLILKNEFSSFVSCLLTGNVLIIQIYKLLKNHADTVFLRILIVVFFLSFILLIGSVIQTYSKNKYLSLKVERNRLEYELMVKYAEEIKKQSLEIRKFRHDYINILSSIEYYLTENKIDELKDFYHNNVSQTKSLFKKNILHLDNLEKISSIEIRSILTTKLISAQEKNIDVQIEVNDPIPNEININPIILIRILGILLDNSIEELETLDEKKLLVGSFLFNGDIIFIIQNNARDDIEPLHQLKKEGFSTKGNQHGLGLTNVSELLLQEPQLLLETKILPNKFIQKLTIVKG